MNGSGLIDSVWSPQELLNHMNQQKVRPNLQTFNNMLKVLRRCGGLAKSVALQTFSEMKALGIGPSLQYSQDVEGVRGTTTPCENALFDQSSYRFSTFSLNVISKFDRG